MRLFLPEPNKQTNTNFLKIIVIGYRCIFFYASLQNNFYAFDLVYLTNYFIAINDDI